MSTRSRTVAGLAAVVLALGVGACGAAPTTVPSMPGPMMTSSPSGGDADDGYGGPGGMMDGRTSATPAVPHSGPVAGENLDPAAVATLQSAVDQGAQPWRLDPQMTALAFTRGHFGWMMARTQLTAPDTVLVDDGAGGAVSLHLAQPARTGTTGIWTVTGGSWVR